MSGGHSFFLFIRGIQVVSAQQSSMWLTASPELLDNVRIGKELGYNEVTSELKACVLLGRSQMLTLYQQSKRLARIVN